MGQQTIRYLQRKMNLRGAADARDLLRKANGESARKRMEYALKLQATVERYKRPDKPSANAELAEREVVEARIQSKELRNRASEEGFGINKL